MGSRFKKIFSVFSRAERAVFLAALVMALGSSVVIAANLVKERTVVVPASGGDYTEGMLGQPMHINPVIASAEVDKALVRLLFSSLAEIADKITQDKNSQKWNIRLKENIRWSDGEKITSDDVIFTIQKIQDVDSGSPIYLSWQGVAAKRVSELELEITLGNSYALFPKNLEGLYVTPKHLFAETPSANWRLSKYNLQPVGSGPYEFESYKIRDDGYITDYRLKTNKFYFASKPLITKFNVKFFPDTAELITAFNSSIIDGFATDYTEAQEIKRSYELHKFYLSSYYAVFLNQGQNLAFQDKNVRRALSIAIDRKDLINDILGGNGESRLGPFSKSLLQKWDDNRDSAQIEEAGSLLENAGWSFGSSPVREKSTKGTKVALEFNLSVPQIQFLTKTAEKLRSQWEKIGARVNLVPVSREEMSGDTVKNRDYQAIILGNMPNPPEDISAFWHSSQRFYPGMNLSLYSNKEADNLIADINGNTDESARVSDINDLESTIENDHPAVFLYSPYYLYFSRKDLQGVNTGLIGELAERFSKINGWYLKTARSLK